MSKTAIFFVMVVYLLSFQKICNANAQQTSVKPPVAVQVKEGISEATRAELLAFYDKIKSINEDCRLKRETLRVALSEEAKKALEDRGEERREEGGNN